LGKRCTQLAQRAGFDLPGALGGQPKPGADRAERLSVLAEPVVGPDHDALTFVELFGQVVHVPDLKGVEHLLVGMLGGEVDDRVANGVRAFIPVGQLFLRAARRALGRL
jgi:hypothetical protein